MVPRDMHMPVGVCIALLAHMLGGFLGQQGCGSLHSSATYVWQSHPFCVKWLSHKLSGWHITVARGRPYRPFVTRSGRE